MNSFVRLLLVTVAMLAMCICWVEAGSTVEETSGRRVYAVQIASYPTAGEAEAHRARFSAENPELFVSIGFRQERHTVRVPVQDWQLG